MRSTFANHTGTPRQQSSQQTGVSPTLHQGSGSSRAHMQEVSQTRTEATASSRTPGGDGQEAASCGGSASQKLELLTGVGEPRSQDGEVGCWGPSHSPPCLQARSGSPSCILAGAPPTPPQSATHHPPLSWSCNVPRPGRGGEKGHISAWRPRPGPGPRSLGPYHGSGWWHTGTGRGGPGPDPSTAMVALQPRALPPPGNT